MDRFHAMYVFTRIVELGGFARAADSLQIPRASVTVLIKQLEAHLGVQLLQRTTRQVSTTLDGAAYYQRCVSLLAELEETEAVFSSSRKSPRGVLRIDMPGAMGRHLVIPRLPEFSARYPEIQLELGMNDRTVDLIREGIDCVIRGGTIGDDSLVARPLVALPQATCASPAYLARYGTPQNLEDLAGHRMIEFFASGTGKRYGLDFFENSSLRQMSLPYDLAVNSADGYVAGCEAGYGIMQAPTYNVRHLIAAGRLCEILAPWRPPALPVNALYPPHRQLSRRVRVFVDWLVEVFAEQG